jgi:hypothetical protein
LSASYFHVQSLWLGRLPLFNSYMWTKHSPQARQNAEKLVILTTAPPGAMLAANLIDTR